MTLLTHLPDEERLQWKLALLTHRPPDRPGHHMATFALGAMHQGALRGRLTMPDHWEQAVLTWRSRGFTAQTYVVLHNAVADLARLGYQVPVPPPWQPGMRGARPEQEAAAGEEPVPAAGEATSTAPLAGESSGPAPARRVPRRYRSWGGRPDLGPHALDPDEWAGAGDWVASAVREVVLDVLEAREQAEAGRVPGGPLTAPER